MSTLLLNADAQPVSLLPLSTLTWEEAIKYLVLEKARVVEWYDDWIVRSESWSTRVPAIMMLTEYQKPKLSVRVSRHMIYLRDNYTCQYCGTPVTESTGTLDHVVPLSQGGKSTWLNLSTACKPCNWKKGSKKQKPNRMPHKPDYWELANNRKKRGYNISHPSWLAYIG